MSTPERSDRPRARASAGEASPPEGAARPSDVRPDADRPEAAAGEAPAARPQPASLPPEVSEPATAAAAVPGESDQEAEQGLSPSAAPEAKPHPEVELPPVARAGRLTFGLLGAPLMWAAQMQTLYSLGTMACGDRARISLHLVSLLALLVAAAGAVVAWRAWRAVGPEWPPDAGDVPDRARFMAMAGIITSAGFFLLILAQAIPTFVFAICR